MKDHPQFDYFPEEELQHINADTVRNRTDIVHHIIHPVDQFNYPPAADIEDQANSTIFNEALHQGSLAIDIQIFDEEFFKDVRKKKGRKEDDPADLVKAWNNTPSSLSLQSHVLRHESRQDTVSYSIKSILNGDRSKFPNKGPVEKASEEFLLAAQNGNNSRVSELLNGGRVYVDVSDILGHTALLGAAVNWHQDIINILLDNGADVNHLNNEGISALAACHVYFYPIEVFKYNIAERYLKKPADFEKEKGFDVNDVVKSPVPSTPKKKTNIERKESQIDLKKIKKLRQEYGSASGSKFVGVSIPENQPMKLQPVLQEDDVTVEKMEEVFPNNEEEALIDRTLGTLQIKRAAKTNLDDMLVAHNPVNDTMKHRSRNKSFDSDDDFEDYSDTEMTEFESIKSIRNLQIDVSDQIIERCATNLSQNNMVVSRMRRKTGPKDTMGTVRRLAVDKSQ